MESLKLKSKSVIGLILIISIGFFSFWASSLNADPVDLFLRGLNSDQIKAFKKVASNEICPCGLPVTLLGCIAPGKNCEESRLMSVVLKELVKSNTPKDSLESKFSEVFSPISGKKNKLSVNTAHCIGDPKAEFEIIEYSDFQCPHCKMAVSQLKALTMSKAFKVKVCFRPYPLSGHVLAEKASLIALSIKNSQKFWLFHDRIFANQDNLTEEVIYKIAKDELGYNKAKIEKVLKANKNLLTKIKKEAEAGGLRGTPSFFLNKISFPGFVDLLKIKLSFLAAKKRRIARTKAKSGKN